MNVILDQLFFEEGEVYVTVENGKTLGCTMYSNDSSLKSY